MAALRAASDHTEFLRAELGAFREEPALTVERLCLRLADGVRNAPDTVAWMLDTGLLLRTRPVDGWLPPETIDGSLGEPFFRIERIDPASVRFPHGLIGHPAIPSLYRPAETAFLTRRARRT